MIQRRFLSPARVAVAVAAVALAALALPAGAAAHPSLYETTALVGCTATPNPPTSPADVTCASEQRYVFTNHGYSYVLSESNGKTTGGAINYLRAPGLLRNVPGFNIFTSDATTGAQPHATCDVPALTDPTTVRSWQLGTEGTGDPFYAYVPFQKTAAGVDDSAAKWLPVVQAKTGLNLATIPDAGLEAACEGLPGATASSYVPADATRTSFASFASGTIEQEKAPLQASIAGLSSQVGALTTAGADAAAQIAGLRTEIADLRLALQPLRVALPAAMPSVTALARDGIALTMTGPAKRTVAARLKIGAVQARKLGLRSRILASRSVALDSDGRASFELEPGRAAAARLERGKDALQFAVDATSGDRHTLVSAVAGG